MEDSHGRRLYDRLKRAFDDVEIAERLRHTYEMALEEEARYRSNRRAAYHRQES